MAEGVEVGVVGMEVGNEVGASSPQWMETGLASDWGIDPLSVSIHTALTTFSTVGCVDTNMRSIVESSLSLALPLTLVLYTFNPKSPELFQVAVWNALSMVTKEEHSPNGNPPIDSTWLLVSLTVDP